MSDSLHPSRLVLTAAVPDAEYEKKFTPKIANTPPLPAIAWDSIGQSAPAPLETPATLPTADAVIITWAETEWAALQQVFCDSATPMPYGKRSESSWSGWVRYDQGVPSGLGYWGYYRLVGVGAATVLLFKSNAHYAASQGEQNLQSLTDRLIEYVQPKLILSVGTAGGARATDPVGTVNVVRADALYESSAPQSAWPRYDSAWAPDWTVLGAADFAGLLFPTPTTVEDLAAIAQQFNSFYHTTYTLDTLNPDNLNMGAATPAINNLAPSDTALVTAKSFVVANTSGNLASFACVEMDDAIIARAASGKVAFGSVRNISDPIQSAALPEPMQGHWGEAIYTAYGFYTSFNGALAAWAVLAGQFAGLDPGAPVARDADPILSAVAARAAHRAAARLGRSGRRARLPTRGDAEAHRLRGRARVLAATGGAAPIVVRMPITNVHDGQDYTGAVAVGSQGKTANVILDTGSSTVAIETADYSGVGDEALIATTLVQRIDYGTGGWGGPVLDTSLAFVTQGPPVALPSCPLAITSVQQPGNFQGVGGILGLAYNALNDAWDFKAYLAAEGRGASYPWSLGTDWTAFDTGFENLCATAKAVKTDPTPYFDALENAGVVANKFAFYTLRSIIHVRAGTDQADLLADTLNQGYFILGGGEEQEDLYTGVFSKVKVLHTAYYNTNLRAVRVGDGADHPAAPLQAEYQAYAFTNAIIDSGTSNLSLAEDVYKAVLQGLEGANPAFIKAINKAARTGSTTTPADLASWPPITFILEGDQGQDVALTCAPQTYWQVNFPRPGQARFQISGPLPNDPLTTQSILGLPLMNNYYTVFDRSEDVNGVVSFATIKPPAGGA